MCVGKEETITDITSHVEACFVSSPQRFRKIFVAKKPPFKEINEDVHRIGVTRCRGNVPVSHGVYHVVLGEFRTSKHVARFHFPTLCGRLPKIPGVTLVNLKAQWQLSLSALMPSFRWLVHRSSHSCVTVQVDIPPPDHSFLPLP
mmetsp:Transcript_23238/g.54922  ORF Transcript_23238/g.54922 Transcript_23238/m.54922 type:complete len:145 (+) Transcript_23238:327-761(+)